DRAVATRRAGRVLDAAVDGTAEWLVGRAEAHVVAARHRPEVAPVTLFAVVPDTVATLVAAARVERAIGRAQQHASDEALALAGATAEVGTVAGLVALPDTVATDVVVTIVAVVVVAAAVGVGVGRSRRGQAQPRIPERRMVAIALTR